jgi:hypothetical protein
VLLSNWLIIIRRDANKPGYQSGMDELRILSPTGVCGSGFVESSFEKALAQKPHVIGCDGGSTDPGPAYLGSGRTAFPKEAIRRDLRLMLLGARRLKSRRRKVSPSGSR